MTTLLTPLLPHQENVVEKIKDLPGLLLYHGVGSGKTLSSIAMANELGGRATVLAPASLLPNYRKELERHLENSKNFRLVSMQGAARDLRKIRPTDILIVDEAHRIRNPKTRLYQALEKKPFEKTILLTGTPMYNQPTDIDTLLKLTGGNVDYYKTTGSKDFPTVKEEVIKIPVAEEQKTIFDFYRNPNESLLQEILNKLPPDKYSANIQKGIPPPDFFHSITRQVANAPNRINVEAPPLSPKLQKVVEDIENRPGKTVVYSNFLDSGLKPVAKELENRHIPFALFTGETKKEEKKTIIDQYNKGKLPVILLSSAGSEGLDLKGTRQIQIIEPHWNNQKIEQIIGRGVRYKSHENLPEEERNVTIKKYIDTYGTRKKTVDEYLYNISQSKLFQSLIRENSLAKRSELMPNLQQAINRTFQEHEDKADKWKSDIPSDEDIPNVQFKNPGVPVQPIQKVKLTTELNKKSALADIMLLEDAIEVLYGKLCN